MPWGVPHRPVWKSKHCWCPRREEPEGEPLFCSWGSLRRLQAVYWLLAYGWHPHTWGSPALLTPTMPSSRPGEREEGGWWLGHLSGRGQRNQRDPLATKDSVVGVPVSSGDRPTPPPFVDGLHHAFQAWVGPETHFFLPIQDSLKTF